ncbi:MAG: hypothetical protein R3A44_12755 [Caldilineaceae bacterium]
MRRDVPADQDQRQQQAQPGPGGADAHDIFAEDIKLVDGDPGERRRYLDIALCQISRCEYRGRFPNVKK